MWKLLPKCFDEVIRWNIHRVLWESLALIGREEHLTLMATGILWAPAQSAGDVEVDVEVEVEKNVTGVLGEEVVLRCQYTGQEDLIMSSWALKEGRKTKRLAGYAQEPFSNNKDFSVPVSARNLTVSMQITSLKAEREYWCSFSTREDLWERSVFLTVLARPDVHTNVESTVENGTHYQMASCSAIAGKPAAAISWSIDSDHTKDGGFSVSETTSPHHNGTATQTSVLRFPTHLQEAAEVTCVVSHPALPEPIQEAVRVHTYVAPTVTLETRSVGEGAELQEVSCVAAGGRPAPSITWLLSGDPPEDPPVVSMQRDEETDTVTVTSSVRLRAYLHEGENVTCVVTHPKLPWQLQETVTLPTYELSSVRVFRQESAEMHSGNEVEGQVVLPEGQKNVSFRWEAAGNVPHYQVTCARENGSLPEGVEVTGNVLYFEGPIEPLHAGIYNCQASYYSHILSVPLEIVVTPIVVLPGAHGGVCVIEHPALVTSQTRPMTLPACESPNVTISSSSVWEENTEYTEVECSVAGGENRATISWSVEDGDCEDCASELAKSLTACLVGHPALRAPERREIWVPSTERGPSPSLQSPVSPVPLVPIFSVGQQKGSALWLAVCKLKRAPASVNISWVLPENSTGRTTFRSGREGRGLWAKSTYEFPLAQQEGKNLTCLIQDGHNTGERTLHIPQFYISSLRVLNKTTSYHWPLEEGPVTYRVALQAHTPGQRILLRVHGNVPQHNITCTRSDGSAVRMEGEAMAFPPEVSEKDAGLYTCHASFYHHSATVLIQVEVTSDDLQLWMLAAICFSSAAAVSLILVVSICVFCKRNGSDGARSKHEASHRKRESLTALTSLMQDPCSPELKNPHAAGRKYTEYAELVRYSIVIDVKTTV
ncbi:hypothetical protein SKAU_G00084850 [Synaphobranchus kaupii]|uniref:Ig-like domain-containing protein n=1 Tax=Synaphobranchus kaupii TaxID=118154 RepID=A0A9Q1FVP9_SYNKA|nr:hypothetical protein SKAU_G00084850 [Synaphobranchus kaupii]